MWFVKSKRAQTSDDDETWLQGGIVPTLNAFDMGDTRATVVIVMREREGKAGGGKGFLLAENRSFTLATSNFQIIFYGQRVGDVRVQDDKINTLQARMGTGGNNMPMVAEVFPIQGTVIGRSDEAGPQGKGFANDGEPMFTLDRVSGHGVATTSTVRRLTPTECERLQGFPDGWTEGQADSHRYKQMGNAVAVPVVQWIINRLTN
jgi:site-specific DNA-cytosine methylase